MTADQHAPSTRQPVVDLEAIKKELDAVFAEHAEHPQWPCEHWGCNTVKELVQAVESLRQQLAAAQQERDTWKMAQEECHELQLLAEAQVEELRQRVSDYYAAEGTAVAQRNAALNEALGYKRQAEALRGALRKHAVFQVRALQTHCAECSATWTGSRDGAAEQHKPGCLAALDAASAGQSQEQVQVPEALVAFRSRFRGSADLSTFTQFGFFEAGYVAGRHAEHVRTGRWETDCPACGARRVNATG